MAVITDRVRASMEAILDETCRSLPHGGDHELRAFIAHHLTDTAQTGLTTRGELGIVARKALAEYAEWKPKDAAERGTGG